MKAPTFSSKVKFQPWIGKNYEKTRPRMLILGESIYDPNANRKTVRSYIHGVIDGWNKRFFSIIQSAFSREEEWRHVTGETYELDREAFWNRVCFTEYVQEPLVSKNDRPTLALWNNAHAAFIEVLSKLKPDIVIAVGFETYKNLPAFGTEGKTFKRNGKEMPTWKYPVGRHIIRVCGIQHPQSRGFSQTVWEELFGAFLKDFEKSSNAIE